MTVPESLRVLYFEDEAEIADLICQVLRDAGHQVLHLDRWPAHGLSALQDLMPSPPDVVLLDVNLPGTDGYQICQLLRQDYLPAESAVLFTSGLMADDDIMQAYSAGADDYLIKPIRMQELLVKVVQVWRNRLQQHGQEQQTQSALQMAFDAMRTSSELGEILRFQESLHPLHDENAIAAACFNMLQEFGLMGSLLFFMGVEPVFYRDDGGQPTLERESMLAARARGRMYHWKHLTFLNFEYVTILFRNMPITDEARYGVVKDQICLMFNGMDAKLSSLMLVRREAEKQQKLKAVTQVLAAVAREIEQQSEAFAQQFERILLDMETNLQAELAQFNLMETEEAAILGRINESLQAATQLFDESVAAGNDHKMMLNKLLGRLSDYT